jgi:hypothetical protein
MKNYLGDKVKKYYLSFGSLNFFIRYLIIFLIVLCFIMCLRWGGIAIPIIDSSFINRVNDEDLYKYATNDNSSNNNDNVTNSGLGEGKDKQDSISVNAPINVNTPYFNVSIPREAANNIAAAGSSAGGASVGYRVAKAFGGTPATKLALGVGTMLGVQASTVILGNQLNSNISKEEDKNKKLLMDLIPGTEELSNKYTEYPLNLLSQINVFINLEIFYMLFILNIYVTKLFSKIDFNKYLPNNKIGKWLSFLINRYFTIWGKLSNKLLIFCICCLIYSMLAVKYCLFLIIQN